MQLINGFSKLVNAFPKNSFSTLTQLISPTERWYFRTPQCFSQAFIFEPAPNQHLQLIDGISELLNASPRHSFLTCTQSTSVTHRWYFPARQCFSQEFIFDLHPINFCNSSMVFPSFPRRSFSTFMQSTSGTHRLYFPTRQCFSQEFIFDLHAINLCNSSMVFPSSSMLFPDDFGEPTVTSFAFCFTLCGKDKIENNERTRKTWKRKRQKRLPNTACSILFFFQDQRRNKEQKCVK